ncbi:hypothetical protein CC86DRAFT_382947 [Ophiobolus disseminans]|uniref:Secreted protein n=1 Tax=Ophiobolus disseminans TaxID=1469910 RepID=A0A6A6ZYR3_9PLEO|nr:hypothetical protein CC86DRAFT_382947 [Ophiobolus disseminans]
MTKRIIGLVFVLGRAACARSLSVFLDKQATDVPFTDPGRVLLFIFARLVASYMRFGKTHRCFGGSFPFMLQFPETHLSDFLEQAFQVCRIYEDAEADTDVQSDVR